MILVASVRHSGTMFVFEHLLHRKGLNRHFSERNFPDIYQYIKGRNIIVPLRKLDSIINSWSGRQLSPDVLDKSLGKMIDFVREYSPYLMPIDHDNRQEYLNEINNGFGLDLKTDWPVINQKSHHHCGDDFSECQKHKDFFNNIYRA